MLSLKKNPLKKFLRTYHHYDKIAGISEIGRRVFAKNSFDGILTIMGVILGSFGAQGSDSRVIIITGVVGAYLARMEGLKVLQNIQRDMNQFKMPEDTLLEGVFILVGGIMLLTPGFLTDGLGFLFVVPFSRKLLVVLIKKRIQNT